MGKNLDTQHEQVELTNFISLKHFPPKLRKLAKFMLESDTPMTVMDACRVLKLNHSSIYTLIYKSKQKGNDFNGFIDEQAKSILHANKVGVYKAIVQGAVSATSTAHNNQKLFTQLTGDLKESTNINIGTLTVGVNVSALPVQDKRDKGAIDIEPFIPGKR